MRLGPKEKRVVEAFIRHEHSGGQSWHQGDAKLWTDGQVLDGLWMGGSNIAEWIDGSIHFNDLGSKAAQTVQRAVRAAAKRKHQNPTFWIQDALKHHKKGALHRQMGVPMGKKISAAKLRAAARRGSTKLARRARLALTLRKLGQRRKKRRK